jgi:hypothetical protein
MKPLELEIEVAKKAAKRKITRKEYEASDIKLLKMHSKAQNTGIETSEVDEAFGGLVEAEGPETRDRSRSSTVRLARGL